jgi:hypothetical protein
LKERLIRKQYFDEVERMLNLGQVVFAVEMILAIVRPNVPKAQRLLRQAKLK